MQSSALSARRASTPLPMRADNLNDASERRAWPRTRTIYRIARVQSRGDSGLCRIQNMSDVGLMLMTSMRLTVGAPITLALSDDVSLNGTIVWTDEIRAGVQFASPIDSAGILTALAEELGSGRHRQQRLAVNLRAVATTERGIQAVRVLNVSQQGMRITHDGSLHEGLTVKVSLESGIERRGVVRWCKDAFAGLKLLDPIPLDLLNQSAPE